VAANSTDGVPRPRRAAGGKGGSRPQQPGEFTPLGEVLQAQPADTFGWCAPQDAGAAPGSETRSGGGSASDSSKAGFAVGGPRAVDLAAAIVLAWPQVVGEEVAANSQPVRLTRGRLAVAVSSTVWAQTLHFMEQTITRGLNERLGAVVIESMAFRHAGWQERPRRLPAHAETAETGAGGATSSPTATRGPAPGQAPSPEFTPEQQAALRSVEDLELGPQLAEKIVAAMKASFVRAQRGPVR
jgi:hypothetical protein